MQHAAERASEIRRKELVQEVHECLQGGLTPWLEEEVEMTCHPGYVIPYVLHLPPFLCLLYFYYKHLVGAAHNSPGRPRPQGASQAQHNVKTNNSGGDLQDYKNTGECFISSVSCCSEVTMKGQNHHYTGALPYPFSRCYFNNKVIQPRYKVVQKNTTAFRCIAIMFSHNYAFLIPSYHLSKELASANTFSQTQGD